MVELHKIFVKCFLIDVFQTDPLSRIGPIIRVSWCCVEVSGQSVCVLVYTVLQLLVLASGKVSSTFDAVSACSK